MVQAPVGSRKTGSGIRLLIVVGLLVAFAGIGGYYLLAYRKQQNTQKLLRQATEAVAAQDWDEAAVNYHHYLLRQPDDVSALASYADVLLEQRETSPEVTSDAMHTLQRLAGLQPDNPDPLAKITDLYLTLHMYSFAEESGRNWVKLAPMSSDAAADLARTPC